MRRTKIFQISVTPNEKRRIISAAKREGMTASKFIRSEALKEIPKRREPLLDDDGLAAIDEASELLGQALAERSGEKAAAGMTMLSNLADRICP